MLGLLSFATCVVPGRAFLRRLFDLTAGVRKSFHFVKLNQEAKADLLVWKHFLAVYNGKSFFHSSVVLSTNRLRMYTDASGVIGYAAVFGASHFYGLWPEKWHSFNITVLELYPIVAAIRIWGSALANKRIEFVTDNQALVWIINQQTSKSRQVMFLLRMLILDCLKWNIWFSAVWIDTKRNIVADCLSRFQVDLAHSWAPWLNPEPAAVPSEVLPCHLKGMPEN